MKSSNNDIKEYLSEIGRKGGKKSKRKLTSEQAKEMVRIREEKKKLSQEDKQDGKQEYQSMPLEDYKKLDLDFPIID